MHNQQNAMGMCRIFHPIPEFTFIFVNIHQNAEPSRQQKKLQVTLNSNHVLNTFFDYNGTNNRKRNMETREN